MYPVSDQRPYNSPLREQQALRTKEQICESLIDLISELGANDLNIKDLAQRAGVSERTVYRHFPDRSALIDGLFDHIDSHADWSDTDDIAGVGALRGAVEHNFGVYDSFERETRALVLMNLDPGRTAAASRRHVADIRSLVADRFPDLSNEDTTGVGALLNLLVSSRTWLRLLDAHGIAGAQSARYISWVVDLIISDLESGATIP